MGCGIYQIKNTESGKRYIGSSVDTHVRFIKHKSALNNDRHKNQHLQNSWNKYGGEVFEFELVEECDEGDLLDKEQNYLDGFLSANLWDQLYNISEVAELPEVGLGEKNHASKLCVKDVVEMKELFLSGKYNDGELADNFDVCRSLVSQILRGELWREVGPTISKEKREKINRKNQSGENHGFYGKSHDEETKHKISDSLKGRSLSEETKRKISESSLEKSKPDEFSEKISEAQMGENNSFYNKEHSEETKQKMSENRKGSKHPNASLDEGQVKKIKFIHALSGLDSNDLAEEFPVSKSTIVRILNGEAWSHVNGPEKFDDFHRIICKQAENIYKRSENGESGYSIAKDYPVSKGTIYRVIEVYENKIEEDNHV